MAAFAPPSAALEGFRLIKREPQAAFVWMLLWFAALLFTAIVVARSNPVMLGDHGRVAPAGVGLHRFGPFAAVPIAFFVVVWAITTVAAYRAVLRPQESRYFFLRLGADELRLAIMTIASFVLVLVFGGAPAYLLFILADPLMRALPDLAREIATAGAVATVILDVWLGIRLSLISVETFAEKRFHLTAYWPLTHGRFWYLFFCYFLCFVIVFILTIFFVVLGGVIYALANPDLGVGGGLLRRTSVLVLAALLAVLTAGYWVISTTLFCACQAFAFRAIVSEGHSDVVIVMSDRKPKPKVGMPS